MKTKKERNNMKTIKIVMLDKEDRKDRCFCEADVVAGVLPNGFVRILKDRYNNPAAMSKKNFLKYLVECCNKEVSSEVYNVEEKDEVKS
jgi:hypothetical protein